jgi:hypothetical protein
MKAMPQAQIFSCFLQFMVRTMGIALEVPAAGAALAPRSEERLMQVVLLKALGGGSYR